MALNEIRSWLIAYDIASPRRLVRVHRLLREYAVPVQYSVFAARCSAAKLGSIRMDVAGLIKPREDDVRFYPVPEPASLFVFGRKALPEGLLLLDGCVSVPPAPRPSGSDMGSLLAGGGRALAVPLVRKEVQQLNHLQQAGDRG
jgi:CRISPR-associated protein Cas2